MDESLTILLRHFPPGSERPDMLVEISKRWSEDDPEVDGFKAEFLDFVRQAEGVVLPTEGKLDVYIGWWGNQGGFAFPVEFFDLISKNRWEVALDIND